MLSAKRSIGRLRLAAPPMTTYTPKIIFAAAYIVLCLVFALSRLNVIPATLQMLLYAGTIVYIGSHHSLSMMPRQLVADQDDVVWECSCGESFPHDAKFCPWCGTTRPGRVPLPISSHAIDVSRPLFFVAAMVVAFLYLAQQLNGGSSTDSLFDVGFAAWGSVAVGASLDRALSAVLLAFTPWRLALAFNGTLTIRIPLPWARSMDVLITKASLVAYMLSGFVYAAAFRTNDWTLNNMFTVAVSVSAIDSISVGRFLSAFLLSGGLFVHDVVTARAVEGASLASAEHEAFLQVIVPQGSQLESHDLLKLGDVILPGLIVAMCLRFDAYEFIVRGGLRGSGPFGEFPKRLFWPAYLAYLTGLFCKRAAMTHSELPQTNILYCVPLIISTCLIASAAQGKLPAMFKYKEDWEETLPQGDIGIPHAD